MKDAVEVAQQDLLAVLEILNAFEYESDEDSCMGMSFFKARLCEDSFFHIKWKLEELLKSSTNAKVEAARANREPISLPPNNPCHEGIKMGNGLSGIFCNKCGYFH